MSDLIGELSTRSDEFATRWARQNVRLHRTARKRLHNRVVGDIELTGDALELPGDDLTLIAYTADPGSTGRGPAEAARHVGAPPGPAHAGREPRPVPTSRSPAATDDRPAPRRSHDRRDREKRDAPCLTFHADAEQRRRPCPPSDSGSSRPRRTRPAPPSRPRCEAGYRHIDTAAAYGNERQVGEADRRLRRRPRSEVFVETKIWISDYGYDETLHGFEKSARKLGVDQIDLLILHQALPSEFEATLEAYRALETLLADGKVRAIGVSNFMVDHLTTLLDKATVVPAVNQIEVHPYFQQREVQALGAEHGILTQAWSPIGGITFYRDGKHTSTLQDPVIGGIAEAHGKTPAQVMLRWHLQQGRSVIPKSTKPARIAENLDVFDFDLTADELAAIDALDTGQRGGPEPEAITLEAFGRADPRGLSTISAYDGRRAQPPDAVRPAGSAPPWLRPEPAAARQPPPHAAAPARHERIDAALPRRDRPHRGVLAERARRRRRVAITADRHRPLRQPRSTRPTQRVRPTVARVEQPTLDRSSNAGVDRCSSPLGSRPARRLPPMIRSPSSTGSTSPARGASVRHVRGQRPRQRGARLHRRPAPAPRWERLAVTRRRGAPNTAPTSGAWLRRAATRSPQSPRPTASRRPGRGTARTSPGLQLRLGPRTRHAAINADLLPPAPRQS